MNLFFTFFINFQIKRSILLSFFYAIAFFFFLTNFILYNEIYTYSYLNINIYSSLIFKISSLWNNYVGSIYLWFTINLIFIYYSKFNKFILYNNILIYIYTLLNLNFFNLCFNKKLTVIINPFLTDIIMNIHPPLLFLGTVSFICVLFFYNMYKWLYFLIIGILLGSLWAYYELGWGGFWFWDIIEIIPLISLIFYLVIIHLKQKKHLFFYINLMSIIYLYIYLTNWFLIKSGNLKSIHTFSISDINNNIYIILFIFFFLFILWIFIYKLKIQFFINFQFIYWFEIILFKLLISCFLLYNFSSIFFNFILGNQLFNNLVFIFFLLAVFLYNLTNIKVHIYHKIFILLSYVIFLQSILINFTLRYFFNINKIIFDNLINEIENISFIDTFNEQNTLFNLNINNKQLINPTHKFFSSSNKYLNKPGIATNVWGNLYVLSLNENSYLIKKYELKFQYFLNYIWILGLFIYNLYEKKLRIKIIKYQ